jgi:hypothetical protein
MRFACLTWVILVLLVPLTAKPSSESSHSTAPVRFSREKRDGTEVFALGNGLVRCSITIKSGALAGDRLEVLPSGVKAKAQPPAAVEADADFAIDVMWTDWQAPGKVNNADNPVVLTKEDFAFRGHTVQELASGAEEVELTFEGRDQPLEVRLDYELEPGAFYVRRRLAVRQGAAPSPANAVAPGPHFLRWVWPRRGEIKTPPGFSLLKAGGFGQPAAILAGAGGAFFGLEYPTAENSLSLRADGILDLACGQEVGERLGAAWIESESVVEAVTPDPFVKHWFWRYLDRVRAAAERPYVLYNSWYDFRSPDDKVGPDRILNETNLVRAAGILGRKLVREQGTRLDAFVLDDGWDTYAGPWELSPEQFPHGLAPVAEALKPMEARLGIWIGPIGGYNRRADRVNWLREHGYETVDGEMCVAGEHYKALLKKRVADFIRKDGVAYFKWDGIQFSCSEPGHGHLPDVYSRRAVMRAVTELCREARSATKDMFLNITSGTWLSPWWVRYADAIWMQGQDYGFADVPSITRRDRSTTYRDSVLYDDLRKHDLWFPVSSLMTHGVIRARISPFADPAEPLDKFTDEVALYAARGIAMWELYISPDLLTDGEWKVEASAIRWLKANFETLKTVEMIGGDPRRHEAYGYAHFRGRRGIVAARNPVIEPQSLRFEFKPAFGLSEDAEDLVLERIYPSRWISPRLFKAGESTDLPLAGFETAIFEIYPRAEAREPLLAGAVFDARQAEDGSEAFDIFETAEKPILLNPGIVREAIVDAKAQDAANLMIPPKAWEATVTDVAVMPPPKSGAGCGLRFKIRAPVEAATLAILLTPAPGLRGKDLPRVEVTGVSGLQALAVEEEKGSWAWHKFAGGPGDYDLRVRISRPRQRESWHGRLAFWLITRESRSATSVTVRLRRPSPERRVLLPLPFPAGILSRTFKLGDAVVRLDR